MQTQVVDFYSPVKQYANITGRCMYTESKTRSVKCQNLRGKIAHLEADLDVNE